MAAGFRRGVAGLIPAERRDWVEAAFAEAPETPGGLHRLSWRAGGMRLAAREVMLRRGVGGSLLFAAAATAAVWVAWPGSSASVAGWVARVEVITLVVLAALPLLARPLLGPLADGKTARLVRFGTAAAFLALIPAETVVDHFNFIPPRGGIDLRLYGLISKTPPGHGGGKHVLVLGVMALYAIAIVWMTSRRSRVAPATLAAGASAGLALGFVMYAVAPLGLSSAATNPWLPGADVDPLVLLAWLLLFAGPLAAGFIAHRRLKTSSSSPPSARDTFRQVMAAGLLTILTGALFVNVLGTGTIAAMLKSAWLRNWLYHGHHLLYGVQNLSFDLKTSSATAYAHEITGATDSGGLMGVLVFFPLIALLLTAWQAAGLAGERAAEAGGSPPPGGGGPPGPGPTPDGGPPSTIHDDIGPAPVLQELDEPGLDIDRELRVPALAAAGAAPAAVR
jgi:hypothetical protein